MRSRTKSRRGSLTVEAALLLPLIFMLTFGLIEYGWMFLKQQQITNTARQCARLGAMVDGTNAAVTSQIGTMMTNYGLGSSGYTATISPGNVATAARGTQISVTISIPYANIDVTGFTLLPMPTTISSKVSMQKEGP
jgi:Flp pilus assembly protein TadG